MEEKLENLYTKSAIRSAERDVEYSLSVSLEEADRIEQTGELLITGKRLGNINLGTIVGLDIIREGKLVLLRAEVIKIGNQDFVEDSSDVTLKLIREKSDSQKWIEQERKRIEGDDK